MLSKEGVVIKRVRNKLKVVEGSTKIAAIILAIIRAKQRDAGKLLVI